jgi:hypothetical protein
MTSATEGMILRCYIKGERNIFDVSISPSDTIDDLKNEIYKKGSCRSFVGCDPMDLTLTKVRYIMVSM